MPQRDVVRSESRPTSGFAMRAKIAPTPITSPRLPSVFTGSMCLDLERHRHHDRGEQGQVDAEVHGGEARRVPARVFSGVVPGALNRVVPTAAAEAADDNSVMTVLSIHRTSSATRFWVDHTPISTDW